MRLPESFFGSMSPEQFLAEYWQKKPLLVRGAWPGFEPPFGVEKFKRLAMRDDALARLIRRRGDLDWELREGPFAPEDFASLPETRWTLLIQEMDRLVEDVHGMLRAVDFLPTWRLDDIMVSYAMPDGGVGAHIDNYDVFLLQGLGRRRWQIDTAPVEEEILLEDVDVSILADFTPDEDWILEPGDMLYLPPRIAHHGEAVDPCMTFSFGCRAPSELELVSGLLEQAMQELDPDARFSDPMLSSRKGGEEGRLGGDSLAWARDRIRSLVDDRDRLQELLGGLFSEPRRYAGEPVSVSVTPDELVRRLSSGEALRPVSASQGLFERTSDGDVLLFLSGEGFRLDGAVASEVAALTSIRGLSFGAPAAASSGTHSDSDVGADGSLPHDPEWIDFLVDLLEQGLLKFSKRF